MKALVTTTIAAAALAGCAAPQAQQGPLEIASIHEAAGTKQQLCSSARDWAALTFRDSKAVVEVFDAEQGKMIGKGRVQVVALLSIIPVDFTLFVECRDGKARATYQSFAWSAPNGGTAPLVGDPLGIRGNTEREVRKLDESLGAYLRSPKVGGQW